ncbi:MAG: 2-hydroxychromene-2-carboxylate isomerase [Sandaracinaceae bacterium]
MTVDVLCFFNFRSPYCYLASRRMWVIEDRHDARILFRPLPGWAGRSAPDRAKIKLPISRQDVQRWCKRFGYPFVPPPKSTDPTRAGAVSLLAEERGVLRDYVIQVMAAEWAEGKDIGDLEVLGPAAEAAGLDRAETIAAAEDPARLATLDRYAEEARARGLFGVPTFVIGDQVFWGQDRLDFVTEHLEALGGQRVTIPIQPPAHPSGPDGSD